MRAALDQRHARANPAEKLRKLNRNSASSKDNERFWQVIERQSLITREISNLIERGEWRRRNTRAGANNKILSRQFLPVAQFDRVRIGEAGIGADEPELPGIELFHAII